MEKFESKVRITGIGMSQVGRRLERNPVGLAAEACLNAMRDAGLERKDIDGLSSHPGPLSADGYSGAGIGDIEQALRFQPRWFNSGFELPGHSGALSQAVLAVAAGACRHALVFRATWESTAQARNRFKPAAAIEQLVDSDSQWRVPMGAFSPANWIAMYAARHFHKYGTTREQLGAIALNARANAMLNERAVYRTPLSMEDYLGARMISTPFGLYDCDVPCDGAVALIISSTEAARDTRRSNPLCIESIGMQTTEPWSWDQGGLDHEPLIRGACDSMWARTDLKPADVDLAQLYDGFSFNAMCWLELMGFCPEGEGGRFVEGLSLIHI